jgi:hydrogenase-4 component F
MNISEILIPLLFAVPAIGIAICLLIKNPQSMLAAVAAVSGVELLVTAFVAVDFAVKGSFGIFRNNIVIDALSVYHIILVNLIFAVSAVYSVNYFRHEIKTGVIRQTYISRYCMLWLSFQTVLLLVLLSNNIGIMWVALEATTLVSAFLILNRDEPLSIEAMWKYLLVCSVGIVFAFMGTVMTVAAAKGMHGVDSVFLFSSLRAHPELIDAKLILFAFIFIVVGYGTKAGLSPIHTWLPDAHSQAPTPVSAVFSGVMLNVALYCIMRYLPVADAALGFDGQARGILLLFGFLSIVFAAVFISVQHDIKRLLAYCSVEHMGIIAIGLGLGGIGTFAALLHTFNHSVSKVLGFFSAGHIVNYYGTRDMRQMSGAATRVPLWGTAFFVAMLVLVGVAPFSVFMSEFIILKEAFYQGRFVLTGLFLFCTLAIFMSILRHVMNVSFGENKSPQTAKVKPGIPDAVIVVLFIAALLLLGLWIPSPFNDFLKQAAKAVENGIKI